MDDRLRVDPHVRAPTRAFVSLAGFLVSQEGETTRATVRNREGMVVIGVPVANQVVNDVHALSQAYHFQQLAKGFAKAFLSRGSTRRRPRATRSI